MATSKVEAQNAILEQIAAKAKNFDASEILALAEAWAWLERPNNSHGGGATPSS